MKRIILFVMKVYGNIVGAEPDYTIEITRIVTFAVTQLTHCYSEPQVEALQDWFYGCMSLFPDNQTTNAKSALRSHFAWKLKELSPVAIS